LIDPQVVDDVVRIFLGQQVCPWSQISQGAVQPKARFPYDFAANRLPPPWKRTFPIGLDVEVCSAEALERAWKEASQPYQREHVMPYLYDDVGVDFNQPSRFRVILVNHDVDYGTFRWTVDTAQDFELINLIFQRLGGKGDFSWLDVLALFEREPELAAINSQVAHKTLYEVDHRA
jgi:spore coat polysaccharide biosynthesis protein SpsF